MPLPTPIPGLVLSYAYRWHDQARSGAGEGRKARPCAIIVSTTDDDGLTRVYVAPITHSQPAAGEGVEIPVAVKRRLGLDDGRSWIVTVELKRFAWPGYDLRPVARDRGDVFSWGVLPLELFAAVKTSIAANRRTRKLKTVPRELLNEGRTEPNDTTRAVLLIPTSTTLQRCVGLQEEGRGLLPPMSGAPVPKFAAWLRPCRSV